MIDSLLNPKITCGKDLRKYLFMVGGVAVAILLSVYLYQYQYLPYQAEKQLHTAAPVNQLGSASAGSQGTPVAFMQGNGMGMTVAAQAGPPIRANAPIPGNHKRDGRAKAPCEQCHQITGGGKWTGTTVAMMQPMMGNVNAMAMNVNAGEDAPPSFRGVAMTLRPSVVNINSVTTRANVNAGQQDGQLHFANPSSGVSSESIGSGIVVSNSGHVLTNYHVVKGATGINVTVFAATGTKRYQASTVKVDESLDLALLKIEPDQLLTPAQLGNSDQVEIAQSVLAMGSPFGLDQTVSRGIVSAKRRSMVIDNLTHAELIQTDAAINQGNSGGPLVDRNGMVIGVNTAIYTPTGAFSGVGFTVPINRAKSFMQDVLNAAQPVAWGGANNGMGMNVAVQAAPPIRAGTRPPNSHNDGRNQMDCKMCHQVRGGNRNAAMGNTPGMGLNAAAAAGVPPVIPAKATPPANHKADGRASMICSSCHQIQGTVQGNVVALATANGNSGFSLPQVMTNPMLGMNVAGGNKMVVEGAELTTINPLLADELNLQVADGAFITSVSAGGGASRAGLMAGDVIFKLDGRWVLNPQQLMQRIASAKVGDSLRLGVYRGGERMNLYLVVTGQNVQAAQKSANNNPPAGLVNEIRWLGMELKPVTAEVVAKFPTLAGKQGSLIKDVKPATVADNAGLMKGDVVLKINSAAVTTAGELDVAVARADVRNGVLLLIERGGSQRYVSLQ